MVKTVTPFSSRAKEGATDSPLGDFVEVKQAITSTASAGFYDENGKLTGNISTDRQWKGFSFEVAVPNGQVVLVPGGDPGFIDMSGFSDIFIAIRPSRGGNVAITAVMGPDTNSFMGLEPIAAANTLRGNVYTDNTTTTENLFNDAAESLSADVWNIFCIQGRLKDQKVMQFKITNNAGGDSNIDFAYMRIA
jgi:hypothetical protein